VSALGGGDDEDPRRPFRQVKGKTVYLEQQEGRKKRHMDRAARAAAAAAAAAEQAELGDQPQTPSDQIAYRVRRLASRPRSSTTTTASASTPPPTLPASVTPVAPSTTSSASGSCCASDSVRTPSSFCWSFFLSAPAGHPGFHVTGSQLRLPSAASATSFCCYHYCCDGVYDHFSSGSFCSATSVRVSTSSSFYCRSWIRD
jgi:hypothetical protein